MKQLKAIVINTKMQQTAVVQITRRWTHPIYKKTITKKKKYLCDNQLKVKPGDKVIIQECRPLSKRKKWFLVKKI
ncbi:MAG: 30S ribosomal protein S17 [Patescibacteria group bacterium]|nr:30S ribosomal protein S17 [Patescibacteria group bacterium]